MQTRRNFLLISSAGVGGLCLVTKNGFAISRFRLKREEFAQTPETFAPAMMDEANTKALAHAAMDEARRLGAYYADIRLGETQHLLIGRFSPSPEPDLVISADRQYGIRVLVDGVWGIGTGVSFERDKITQIVGEAVAHAKRQAKALERTRAVRVELAPTVSQTGEWNTPVVIDPFTVPLRIQYEVLDGIGAGLSRTYEGGGNTFFRWWSQRRIFASTDDTFLLQRLKWSDIRVTGPENVPMPSLGPTGGGFEVVADPAWVDRAKAFADDVKEWYRLPITTSVDVGRYPILFDGAAASRFAYTLGLACEADRASAS